MATNAVALIIARVPAGNNSTNVWQLVDDFLNKDIILVKKCSQVNSSFFSFQKWRRFAASEILIFKIAIQLLLIKEEPANLANRRYTRSIEA
jgi:hypothetical protein